MRANVATQPLHFVVQLNVVWRRRLAETRELDGENVSLIRDALVMVSLSCPSVRRRVMYCSGRGQPCRYYKRAALRARPKTAGARGPVVSMYGALTAVQLLLPVALVTFPLFFNCEACWEPSPASNFLNRPGRLGRTPRTNGQHNTRLREATEEGWCNRVER